MSRRHISKAVYLTMLFWWLIILTGYTQQSTPLTVTASEAVEIALEQYPGIRADRLSTKEARTHKKTAWDLGNTQLYTGREEVGNGQDGVRTVIGIQQQQINIFGIAPKGKLAEHEIKLAEAKVSVSELELKKTVKTAWSKAYAAKKSHQVYTELDSVFDKFEHAAKIRLETEAISKLEWLALYNRSRQVTLEKDQALSDYKTAIETLNGWLGSDNQYDVADSLAVADNIGITTDQGLSKHPEVAYYEQQINVADAREAVAKSDWLPQLNAQYGIQEVAGQSGFYSYQVGIRLPLFFGPQAGKTQAAKIRTEIAREIYNEQNQLLTAEYKVMLEQYKKWQQSWQYYEEEALALADEQQKGAVTALKEGALDYITFLQLIQDVVDIKQKAWMALENYLTIRYELEYFI